uniref:Uncharacterized protein MANES_02G197900 n=1 Tax=Rhizophora mucronata TaxID=61149 RepID=A0A2P2KGS3_RHIMU
MKPMPAGSRHGSGGGGGELGRGGLTRFRSAPATWLEELLEGEEEDPLKPSQNLTQLLVSNAPSSINPVLPAEPGLFEPAGFQRQSSSPADFLGNSGLGGNDGCFSSSGMPSNYEYVSQFMDASPTGKTAREVELQHSSAKPSIQLKVEQSEQLIDMERDQLLEDSVPCRVRAKRGCATHPRSIAERVRRTKISDRIRKLQELVPNMKKELKEHQRQCKCMAKEH